MGVLLGHLHPADLAPGAPPANSMCFASPFDPSLLIPEVSYSDDRRFFGVNPEALSHLLEVATHGCWAGGGAVNVSKLRAFGIHRCAGRLQYLRGTIATSQGDLVLQPSGLLQGGLWYLIGYISSASTEIPLFWHLFSHGDSPT